MCNSSRLDVSLKPLNRPNKRSGTVLEPGSDGEIRQPVRLLPLLEAAHPGTGPVGAGGPAGGPAGPRRRREGPVWLGQAPAGGGGGGPALRVLLLHLLASSPG